MTARGAWARRIGWMAAIWVASVLALAAVAYFLRVLMTAAGLTTP